MSDTRSDKSSKSTFLAAVRDGRVPGMSVDSGNPATAYDPMPLDAPKGTKVRFTGYGGFDSEQKEARRHLVVDGVYTVERLDVGSWSSEVKLAEHPGIGFNTVMFACDVPST